MIIEFEKEYLRDLYEEGKASGKQYRFQPLVIKNYKKTIDKLRAANRIEDLFRLTSLNYERLKGDKKDVESVRVDGKYRIEFRSRTEGEAPDAVVTICSIEELTNHYQ